MLIVIGGAPRAGKGIVSRRVSRSTGHPLLALDPLKMGLHHAVPSLGIDPSADPSEVGERMWPLTLAIADNVLDSRSDYVFEGDMLLPRQAAELIERGRSDVRACFLGYRTIEPERKLAGIRRHTGLPNDWLSEHDDAYILDVIRYGIDFSHRLAEECSALELEYFDGSVDFEAAVDEAVSYLTGTAP